VATDSVTFEPAPVEAVAVGVATVHGVAQAPLLSHEASPL
jgi:hypothetical protein